MTFISYPQNGRIYIAERSRKGSRKLIWSAMPEIVIPDADPASNVDQLIDARKVPYPIRRQAYRKLAKVDPRARSQ